MSTAALSIQNYSHVPSPPPQQVAHCHQLCHSLNNTKDSRPGATSHDDLKVSGEVCLTFCDACIRRHLLTDDSEYNDALMETSQFQMPRQLRSMFATIYIVFFTYTDFLLKGRGTFLQTSQLKYCDSHKTCTYTLVSRISSLSAIKACHYR